MTLISTAIGLGVAEIFGVGKGVSYEAAAEASQCRPRSAS